MTSLREQWAAGNETLGFWLSVPSFVSAEIAARQPVDYVCIDTQHGVIDYPSAASMLQAIELAGGEPIVRVPWNEPGIIGKMLDAGVQGVVVPMVNTVAEAEAVVRACRYPPLGERSHGPVMAGMRTSDYAAGANDHVATIPMIETVTAVGNIDDILSVPGVDAIYVGPADLSLSLGLPPGNNDDRSEFTEALLTITAACRRHGVVPGIHATGALAERRVEQGFHMITVAGDLLSMRTHMAGELAAARGATSSGGPTSIY